MHDHFFDHVFGGEVVQPNALVIGSGFNEVGKFQVEAVAACALGVIVNISVYGWILVEAPDIFCGCVDVCSKGSMFCLSTGGLQWNAGLWSA